MTHQMPLLHSGTQRNHKDFSSDVPSNAVLVWHQMQNFFGKIMVVVVFGPSLNERGGGCGPVKLVQFVLRCFSPVLKSFLGRNGPT